MIIHKLTSTFVENVTEDGTYNDGGQLNLLVRYDARSKDWQLRSRKGGRERQMFIGRYPDLSLDEAREKARQFRNELRDGDPWAAQAARKKARDDQKIKSAPAMLFSEVLDKYYDQKIAPRPSPSLKEQFLYLRRKLRKIEDMPVQSIDINTLTEDTGVGLEKMSIETPEAARHLQSLLERVFDLAIHKKYYRGDNPAKWKGRLEHVLEKSKNVRAVKRRVSLPYQDIPRLVAALRAHHAPIARMLEFIVLTCVRPNEVRLATLGQFDFQRMIWTVPTGKEGNTKRKDERDRPREIPITPQMLAVIDRMRKNGIDAYLFPGQRDGKPYGEASCSFFLDKTLKWTPKCHVHGFRTTLADWADETTDFPEQLVKRQFDHVGGDRVHQAYFRSQLFEKRGEMMTAWGEHCDGLRPLPATGTDNVLQITEAGKQKKVVAIADARKRRRAS
jgi:integrase